MKRQLVSSHRSTTRVAAGSPVTRGATAHLTLACGVALFLGWLGGASALQASDPVAVYALIDKVVFEPAEGTPERIQIWGAFAVAAAPRGNDYKAPEKGYLYYTLPSEKPDLAKIEWTDLKRVAGQRAAGQREVIGFGSRYEGFGTLRKADAKPERPDTYHVAWGLVRIKDRSSEYPPIRDLLALKPAKDGEVSSESPKAR